jgi:cation-transporting ATPase E
MEPAAIQHLPGQTIQGLSEAEVVARRAGGQGNTAPLRTSRSYFQILRENAFTFINTVLFAIGIVLVIMDRPGDVFVTAGLVLLNVVVGVVQEGRAKHKLDHIALLTRPRATAIREGCERAVDPSEIVLGDVLVVRQGDQIVVDGQVIGDGRMEVDESLLTGESDPVPRRAGDPVHSGSFCVTGRATYVAEKVGMDGLAQQMTRGARAFRQVKTPLQADIDLVVRLLTITVAQLGALVAVSLLLRPIPAVEVVQIAAVMVALVPQGLFFMITLTYAMGAVRMAGKGAVIEQANAVESLSNVNVLCLDKTGTLTSNVLRLHGVHALGIPEAELRALLGTFAASTTRANRTADALHAAFPGLARPAEAEVPFSSAWKWSGLALDGDIYVLGAPDILQPALGAGHDLGTQGSAWTARGLRVLLFAHRPGRAPLQDAQGRPQLPADLVPLGLVSFSDELRAEAQATLHQFAEAGIRVKIISGDHPETVAALARQAGLDLEGDTAVVSGLELAACDERQLAARAAEATIFGRITPQQKERLVRSLRARGDYVAMIGDGVNDVLALKQANLGIAMESGSQAARSVADMVLLGDSFAALPAAFREGQRIVNGMHDVIRLLLSRTVYVTLLILATSIIGLPFPLTPKYTTVQGLLSVGLPTLALAAWARPGLRPLTLRRALLHFVLPAGYTMALLGLGLYLLYLLPAGDTGMARTVLTTGTLFCGLLLIVFAEPPAPALADGDAFSGDWRPTILAGALLALYCLIMIIPSWRQFFELQPLSIWDVSLIVALTAVWAVALRFLWRREVLERVVGAGPHPPGTGGPAPAS